MNGISDLQSSCKLTELPETVQDDVHWSPEAYPQNDILNDPLLRKPCVRPQYGRPMGKKIRERMMLTTSGLQRQKPPYCYQDVMMRSTCM